ncbi:tumor necrosis factor receptor superfamily member 9a [Gouania willdenowi]|uniref:Tumor necrosis factor receptor superfamily member 5-like n=1 Tax=Gouania willdenowi TaxID=441366 RepID=A0A8C5FZ69_GOUWI|nr:tumor necrosis factor receptor superfamily member 5-like [Gouania willdenowi]XP_028308704.1 tumor necrosis factor receptor superfamily member 5-like [Gouania willdenowi]
MAVILLVMIGLSLLMQSCTCSPELTGCQKWTQNGNGDDVCCEACYPGHRVLEECGRAPKKLCELCDPGKYVLKSNDKQCHRCRECLDPQIIVKRCNASADTVCGCREGLICGDEPCTFCKATCGKGHQVVDGVCQPCPEGTFNNQSQSMCKPWTKRCPKGQSIVAEGDAFTDVKCAVVIKPNTTDHHVPSWLLVPLVVTGIVLMMIISAVLVKILQKRKRYNINQDTKEPEFNTYTDDPRTLIAVECSFHEAQQEQGSSSESLDSSGQLLR